MFGIPVSINVTNKGRSKENKQEMKKNGKMKIVRLFMAITFLLMVAIMSVACGSARTLEDYHEENNLQEALDQQVAGNPCVEAWVEDNELHFKWDVAKDPSVTEEYALSDSMAEDIRRKLRELTYVLTIITMTSICAERYIQRMVLLLQPGQSNNT